MATRIAPRAVLFAAFAAAFVVFACHPAPAIAAPISVTIAGSLQSELSCPGDWQPACAATYLTYDGNDDVWQGTFDVPAGSWEYKAALNNSWDENYGANAVANGANIHLNLVASTTVKFYYDDKSHWVSDNQNTRIVVASGSFQSELGCPGDWDPACLSSWLQDIDGDGIFSFSTSGLPSGNYEAKAGIGESWDENYGSGGVSGGANIPFSVPFDSALVHFMFVSDTNVLTIDVESVSVPAPATLALLVIGIAGLGAARRRKGQ